MGKKGPCGSAADGRGDFRSQINISDVKFVINFDFPGQNEDYGHRIGRTARGKDGTGTSYTFFTKDNSKVLFAAFYV